MFTAGDDRRSRCCSGIRSPRPVGVKQQWAAALGIPAGCLCLVLCILRGVLQGVGDYRASASAWSASRRARLAHRRRAGGVGLGVTGAYIGTPLSFVVMWSTARCPCAAGSAVARAPGAATRPVPSCGRTSRAPGRRSPALGIIAVLQNIDIIAAKHRFTSQPGQLLLRDRGRRQGPDLGGDGRRLLPGARGLAPARRAGEDTPPGARPSRSGSSPCARSRVC